ncbi:hypothetical protein BC629DRAFT_789283 [Irpex lacteus]|nr:hypothetical protein BC629DRAFT_789283 [Irpex lacteus]
MSSVTELEQEVIGNYITVAAGALFFYESLTTLSREVDVIWSRKWTMMTWLYALTRYSTVADEINLLMPVWNFTRHNSCKASVYIDSILHLIRYLSFACFSALRVYALLNENIGSLVAGIVMLLDLVPFATNMFNAITIIVYQDQETCAGLLAGSDRLHLSYCPWPRAYP